MISAKEAKSFADEVTIAARQRKEYPILIGDIEREIARAAKMGRYSVHYWFTDVSFSMMESSLNLNDPVLSAQFNNRSDSSLYVKIINHMSEAGYEVNDDFDPASMYYWTIKWDREDDGYDFIRI